MHSGRSKVNYQEWWLKFSDNDEPKTTAAPFFNSSTIVPIPAVPNRSSTPTPAVLIPTIIPRPAANATIKFGDLELAFTGAGSGVAGCMLVALFVYGIYFM